MATIKEGDNAPVFTLTDKAGASHTVGGKKGEYTVLYFYPKDDTPGCTLEAKEFSAQLEQFRARNAHVFGISGGNDASKAKFCKKHGLSVPLLSDEKFDVSRSYGAFGDKKFMGRSFKGIFRKTFVIDSAGKVVRVFDTVKPEGHAKEVLAALDELSGGAPKGAQKPAAKTAGAKKAPVARKPAAKKSTKRKPAVRAPSKKKVAKKVKVKGNTRARNTRR